MWSLLNDKHWAKTSRIMFCKQCAMSGDQWWWLKWARSLHKQCCVKLICAPWAYYIMFILASIVLPFLTNGICYLKDLMKNDYRLDESSTKSVIFNFKWFRLWSYLTAFIVTGLHGKKKKSLILSSRTFVSNLLQLSLPFLDELYEENQIRLEWHILVYPGTSFITVHL